MSQIQKNIIITSIGHFLVHAMTMILPVILVILENEFSVSLIYLGELATIQILFLGIGGFPAGFLADRFGSRMVLLMYFLGLIIASIWLFFSHTFTMTALGLGFLGLITGLYHPAGLKMVSHSSNVSRYMSYHGVSGSLGLAAGPIYGAWMSSWLGWRYAYLFMGILALAALCFLLTYHREARPGKVSFNLKGKFNRAHILIISVASLWGFAHHGLFNFLPYYFEDAVETSLGDVIGSGFLTGFVLLLGIIGQLGGGRLGEKYPRKNLYIWVVLLNIPFLIGMAFLNGFSLVVITGMLGAVNFMFQPVNNSLLADVTPTENRGIIYGFSAGISFGVGSFAGIAGGYLGELLSINAIFPAMAVVLLPAGLFAILLKKSI
ncbi:MAG: MFS transporter [Candidatus Marinimicrobia bacterium]|nr:MFS transporter [Candidatus Neomarinimicrobiota bacterium]